MKPISKSRRLAIIVGLIEALKAQDYGDRFHMRTFVGDADCPSPDIDNYHRHFCETSHCLAGLIPHIDPEYASNFTYKALDGRTCYAFNTMSSHLIGSSQKDSWAWNWLFSAYWRHDALHAISRLRHFVNNGYNQPSNFPIASTGSYYVWPEELLDQPLIGETNA